MPIRITDPQAAAAVTDWLRTREHAATWAVQELREVDRHDPSTALEARKDPRVQAATNALALWHTTHTVTPEQLAECWQHYANEDRRTHPRVMTQLDHTPTPEKPNGQQAEAYRTAILGHLHAIEAALQASTE